LGERASPAHTNVKSFEDICMVVFIICKKKQQLKKERDYQETDTPRPILIILTSSNFPKLLIHTHFPIHLCPDPTQQKN
jgi:hypothetical protein